MTSDRQGNILTAADSASAALYDEAISAFNIYRGDPFRLLDQALETSPSFVMAIIAKAFLLITSSEPGAIRTARELAGTAKLLRRNDRESSLLAALDALTRGQWTPGALALDSHNIRYPHDMLAVQVGHLVDFLRGNARNLRDRIARILPHWSDDIPGYSVLLGMQAFGLEECGDYAGAERAGRKAVALQPLDCWAHHAVTHVMEMQGRSEDGIGWMIAREPYWSGDDNGFKVHNWWHRALFHLDLGLYDETLALYDGPLRETQSNLAFDLLDASALLWRLSLCGIDVGDRWTELADAWIPHADGQTYPFNDWHAVMALLGAGREKEAERIVADLRHGASADNETGGWIRDFALPLVEGFTAYWHGDYPTSTEKLFPARAITNAFGGSHAQRDIIDWTLSEAALRGGLKDLATAMAHERLASKPHSRINLGFLSRAAAMRATTDRQPHLKEIKQ